jgi:hypothetical protein
MFLTITHFPLFRVVTANVKDKSVDILVCAVKKLGNIDSQQLGSLKMYGKGMSSHEM